MQLCTYLDECWAIQCSRKFSCDRSFLLTCAPCAGAQVYELSSMHFLPKDWIMERWEEGFYITAMAGSAGGSSLVVMSKGTPYTQQSYKVGGPPLICLSCRKGFLWFCGKKPHCWLIPFCAVPS